MSDEATLFNKIAQGRVPFADGLAWFAAQEREDQAAALVTLKWMVQQTHPTAEMIAHALQTAPLKPTVTPVVLFTVHPFDVAMNKVLALPVEEWQKTFSVLLRLLQVADTHRRETQCQKGCTHEWHNLS